MFEAVLWVLGGAAALYAVLILALVVLPKIFDPFDDEDGR